MAQFRLKHLKKFSGIAEVSRVVDISAVFFVTSSSFRLNSNRVLEGPFFSNLLDPSVRIYRAIEGRKF
jgi:hypothetical protein